MLRIKWLKGLKFNITFLQNCKKKKLCYKNAVLLNNIERSMSIDNCYLTCTEILRVNTLTTETI